LERGSLRRYELCSNAFAFVETSEVGGTHPALLEAMAFGNCVVVNDTPENLETIDEAGLSYRGAEGAAALAQVLKLLLDDPSQVDKYRRLAVERVAGEYNWDRVTDQYEALFERVAHMGGSRSG
jgi:glycosyltransferase involved in cell wall biosynthesis